MCAMYTVCVVVCAFLFVCVRQRLKDEDGVTLASLVM